MAIKPKSLLYSSFFFQISGVGAEAGHQGGGHHGPPQSGAASEGVTL